MADHAAESELKIPELTGSQKYHVFISHSTDDRDYANTLTEELENMGFKSFMYERDLPPDSTIIQGVITNMRISRRVILVVTEAFIESPWSAFEAMEAIHKGYNEDRMVLVPILHNYPTSQIPHYLRNLICLPHNEEHFWTRLTAALVEERPASTLVPAGNVAHGLAWSYFYGFLNIVLPEISQRIATFISAMTEPPEMLKKIVIIIPSSCKCPNTLQDVSSESLKFEGHVPCNASRAGNVARDYKSSVYRITDPDTQMEYLFIAEFATPVLSMYEMERDGVAGLSREAKIHQRMLFSDKIQEILTLPDNRESCSDKTTMFEYNDETEENRRQFPKLLCQHIRQQLKMEKDRIELTGQNE